MCGFQCNVVPLCSSMPARRTRVARPILMNDLTSEERFTVADLDRRLVMIKAI